MKIATWNINSIRIRIDQAIKFLRRYKIDVLCLQETKVSNESFPLGIFQNEGYNYIKVNGQKQYNGVATISRIPIKKHSIKKFVNSEEKRHLSVTLNNNFEIHNFYFPAGGSEPDAKKNNKFADKLKFYQEVENWSKKQKYKKNSILLGDMNVAPLPSDVWDHKKLLTVVSHTPIEVKYYNSLYNSCDWVDAVRLIKGNQKKIFTWWSYRSSNWKTYNKGRRLDHIWINKSLNKRINDIKIIESLRNETRPSDHVPIILNIT